MSVITHAYRNQFIKRYDLQGHLHYFTHDDFPGLCKQELSFPSAQGNILRGGLYAYEGFHSETLVIFCHGIGGGHLSYMREIEYLCKNGYQVLAYDNTGCAASDGENIRGMAQSLSDLDACLRYVAKEPSLAKKRLFVIGHSWGGFAAGNILNYHPEVAKVVVIAGFVSVECLMKQFFKGPLRLFLSSIMKYERDRNGDFADSTADAGYRNTQAPVLVIQSEDDPAVQMSAGIGYLQKTITGDRVEYLVTSGKKHNPNYTADAVTYMNDTFAALDAAVNNGTVKTVEEKKNFIKDVDWHRMTEQDTAVWDVILKFLARP